MKLKNLGENKVGWLIGQSLSLTIIMLILSYYFLDMKLDEVNIYFFAIGTGILNTVLAFYFPVYGKAKNKEL